MEAPAGGAPTQVFGGDGLQPHHLQRSGSQDQLAAPGIEVLQKDKSSFRMRSPQQKPRPAEAALTFSRSDRRVSMSVAMDGMSLTHWQYSRKIRMSSRTVLRKQKSVRAADPRQLSGGIRRTRTQPRRTSDRRPAGTLQASCPPNLRSQRRALSWMRNAHTGPRERWWCSQVGRDPAYLGLCALEG